VGSGRVLFSESPPLMRENSDKPPLFNSLKYGALCGVPDLGGAGLWEQKVAETLICKARRDRVSLKSCSGAIHG
jgi:hypothetical protein